MRLLTTLILAAALLSALPRAHAQGRNGPDGNHGNLSRVLHNPDVHQALKLSEEQIQRAQAASDEVVEKHRQDFVDAYNSDDRKLAFRRVFLAVTLDTFAELESILTPSQFKRLQQIELQAFGSRGLMRVNVVEALQPTAEQLSKFDAMGDTYGKGFRDIFTNKDLSPTEKQSQREELQATFTAELQAIMSPHQWQTWNDLLGPPFEPPSE